MRLSRVCRYTAVAYPIVISPRWRAVHLPARSAEPSPIVLQGSFTSSFDGTVIDAAASSWRGDGPGAYATVDRGGLFDLAGGGLQLLSHDAAAHLVTVAQTGGPAPACARHGVSAPCLVWRPQLAHSRLLTQGDWLASLRGELTAHRDGPLLPIDGAGAVHHATAAPWVVLAMVTLMLAVVSLVVLRRRRHSAAARLRRAGKRLTRRIERQDPVLEVTLRPVLLRATESVESGRLDPASNAGRCVIEALLRLERCLETQAEQHRRQAQEQLAEQLIDEVALALEAAAEANSAVS